MEKYTFTDGRYFANLQCPHAGKQWGYGTTDAERMQLRIEKFNIDYIKAGKIRRIRNIGGCSRSFPPAWLAERMSTLDYVRAYYRANSGVWMSSSIKPPKEWVALQLEFFGPLSDRITVPDGVDSVEPWDGK